MALKVQNDPMLMKTQFRYKIKELDDDGSPSYNSSADAAYEADLIIS